MHPIIGTGFFSNSHSDTETIQEGFRLLGNETSQLANVILAFGLILCLGSFIFAIHSFIQNADRPEARREDMLRMLRVLAIVALIGAFGYIIVWILGIVGFI